MVGIWLKTKLRSKQREENANHGRIAETCQEKLLATGTGRGRRRSLPTDRAVARNETATTPSDKGIRSGDRRYHHPGNSNFGVQLRADQAFVEKPSVD